jgi:hypothetical protein
MQSRLRLSFVVLLLLSGAMAACGHVTIGPPPTPQEHHDGGGSAM